MPRNSLPWRSCVRLARENKLHNLKEFIRRALRCKRSRLPTPAVAHRLQLIFGLALRLAEEAARVRLRQTLRHTNSPLPIGTISASTRSSAIARSSIGPNASR